MGKLKENLHQFSSISQEYFQKTQKILEEEYCWKCPQRGNRDKTNCQEIEAWIRLNLALENGIKTSLKEDQIINLDLLVVKYLQKNMKKLQRSIKYDEISIIKLKEKTEPFKDKNNYLIINRNPNTVKINDLVLLPQYCPLSTYWFSRMKLIGAVPFKLNRVSDIFNKKGIKLIEINEKAVFPFDFILGVVIKILDKDDPLVDYF